VTTPSLFKHLNGCLPKSGPVELRVRKKFALLFCETKGLGEYIIKTGCFVKLFAFRFRHTPNVMTLAIRGEI